MKAELKELAEVWNRNTWGGRISWLFTCVWAVPYLVFVIVWCSWIAPAYTKITGRKAWYPHDASQN